LTINYQNLKTLKLNLARFQNTELMIVTKNQSKNDIIELINRGYILFGENKVQEMNEKFLSLKKIYNLKIHLIGPLQTNKVKLVLKIADAIQSIDRLKLVDEVIKCRNRESATKEFFLQVNIGKEPQKSGVMPHNLKELYEYCMKNELPISGLMCIPPNIENPSNFFEEMVFIRNSINKNLKLSMGMSNDYKFALQNQTNIVRIGSFIFD